MNIKEKTIKSIQHEIYTRQQLLNENKRLLTSHFTQFFIRKADAFYKTTRMVDIFITDLEGIKNTDEELIMEYLKSCCESHLNKFENRIISKAAVNHLSDLVDILESEINQALYKFYAELIELLKKDVSDCL